MRKRKSKFPLNASSSAHDRTASHHGPMRGHRVPHQCGDHRKVIIPKRGYIKFSCNPRVARNIHQVGRAAHKDNAA